MHITHLAAHPECIETLANWTFQEWGARHPKLTLEGLIKAFQGRTSPGKIPESFTAMENGRAIGMASLVFQDMSIRTELSPWLAAVFTDPEFRRRGVGSLLVEAVMKDAKCLGVDTLYLFTPDQMNFYRRLDWQDQEELTYHGQQVTIMSYRL